MYSSSCRLHGTHFPHTHPKKNRPFNAIALKVKNTTSHAITKRHRHAHKPYIVCDKWPPLMDGHQTQTHNARARRHTHPEMVWIIWSDWSALPADILASDERTYVQTARWTHVVESILFWPRMSSSLLSMSASPDVSLSTAPVNQLKTDTIIGLLDEMSQIISTYFDSCRHRRSHRQMRRRVSVRSVELRCRLGHQLPIHPDPISMDCKRRHLNHQSTDSPTKCMTFYISKTEIDGFFKLAVLCVYLRCCSVTGRESQAFGAIVLNGLIGDGSGFVNAIRSSPLVVWIRPSRERNKIHPKKGFTIASNTVEHHCGYTVKLSTYRWESSYLGFAWAARQTHNASNTPNTKLLMVVALLLFEEPSLKIASMVGVGSKCCSVVGIECGLCCVHNGWLWKYDNFNKLAFGFICEFSST